MRTPGGSSSISTTGLRFIIREGDDGLGTGESERNGYDLIDMRERVEAVGGELATGEFGLGGLQVEVSVPATTGA